jgi:hypothetical protein
MSPLVNIEEFLTRHGLRPKTGPGRRVPQQQTQNGVPFLSSGVTGATGAGLGPLSKIENPAGLSETTARRGNKNVGINGHAGGINSIVYNNNNNNYLYSLYGEPPRGPKGVCEQAEAEPTPWAKVEPIARNINLRNTPNPAPLAPVAPVLSPSSNNVGPAPAFYWDVETRSAARLAGGKLSVGARAYAGDPSTEVLCVGFAPGDGPVEIWAPGEPVPWAVLAAAANPACSGIAHNAAFERAILEAILIPKFGWPMVPVVRHACSMSLALAHAYPGALEAVSEILGLVNRKDAVREKRVRRMWSPRQPRKGEPPGLYWIDGPELRAELHAYCIQDVATERELHQRLPALPAAEQAAWVIDAEINGTGVRIDVPLAAAASRFAGQALAELDAQICLATGGAVTAAAQAMKLKAWLTGQGVALPRRPKALKGGLKYEDCLEAEDIQKLLAGNPPSAEARAALELRLQAAQSAASKVDRMLLTRCADDRVRGLFRFYGATTGRWSGRFSKART